jgi:SAM-dependent methyltransferase
MSDRAYQSIVEYYEGCLQAHSSGPRAVDWKSEEDARLRYDIMLELVKPGPPVCTLLDFGCGLAALETHIRQRGFSGIRYTGLELSEKFAAAARAAHPDIEVLCMDVLASDAVLPRFDYIVMNGIFTRRHEVSVDAMDRYMRRLLSVVYKSCRM